MPHSGWVAFDPTHRFVAGKRHLRTAIGHDDADVPTPPTAHFAAAPNPT